MARFKVGDRVRVVRGNPQGWEHRHGDEGMVLEDSNRPWVLFDRDMRQIPTSNLIDSPYWNGKRVSPPFEAELELISEDAPDPYEYIALGTRVRVKDRYRGRDVSKGQIGTVIEDSDAPWVTFDEETRYPEGPRGLPGFKAGHMACLSLDDLEILHQPDDWMPKGVNDLDALKLVLDMALRKDQTQDDESWSSVIRGLCKERGVEFDGKHRKATLLRLLGEELPPDVRAELPTATGVANAGNVGGW